MPLKTNQLNVPTIALAQITSKKETGSTVAQGVRKKISNSSSILELRYCVIYIAGNVILMKYGY